VTAITPPGITRTGHHSLGPVEAHGRSPACGESWAAYLLSTMKAQLSWLYEFALSLRSGQLEWPEWSTAAAPDTHGGGPRQGGDTTRR
jgi:hypothetical protein